MTGSGRVLIAGAGIVGLATAKVLHDLGWAVDVGERRRYFLDTPTGLFLPANGLRVFAAFGAAAALGPRGTGSSVSLGERLSSAAACRPGPAPLRGRHRENEAPQTCGMANRQLKTYAPFV